MVCDSSGGECQTQIGDKPPDRKDESVATLKDSLEQLLKCMLRLWCTEGLALAKLGVNKPSGMIKYFA